MLHFLENRFLKNWIFDQKGQKWTKTDKKAPFQISTLTKSASFGDPSSNKVISPRLLPDRVIHIGCAASLRLVSTSSRAWGPLRGCTFRLHFKMRVQNSHVNCKTPIVTARMCLYLLFRLWYIGEGRGRACGPMWGPNAQDIWVKHLKFKLEDWHLTMDLLAPPGASVF